MSGYSSIGSPGENRLRWLLFIAIVILGAYLARNWLGRLFSSSGLDPSAAPRAVTARGALADDERNTIEIFEHVSDSVVFVTTTFHAMRRTMMGIEPLEIKQGTGSGFVWDAEGRIVTNFHVIQGVLNQPGGACIVQLKRRGEWQAKIVGVDPDHDIAVLFISAPTSDLKPIPLGESRNLLVGQKAFAIGNPFGYDNTLTAGIISALDRSIETEDGRRITGLIQTDAAISPGSSGGPLLDSAGLLIGMTTAVSAQRLASNIGFALPVDVINEIVPALIRDGRILKPGLGIAIVPEQALRHAGINKGVMILSVYKGSAAEKSGLLGVRRNPDGREEYGDIILAVDDEPVGGINDFETILSRHKVGDTVKLTIERKGETLDVEVRLQAKE